MDAKSYAFYLLSKRDYFKDELKQKLLKKGFDKEQVENVLSYLEDKGYINDAKLKERQKELTIKKGESPLKLKSKLYRKGVKDLQIDFSEEEIFQAAVERVKKYKKEKEFKKVVSYLINRGFPYSIASKVAKMYIQGDI